MAVYKQLVYYLQAAECICLLLWLFAKMCHACVAATLLSTGLVSIVLLKSRRSHSVDLLK